MLRTCLSTRIYIYVGTSMYVFMPELLKDAEATRLIVWKHLKWLE